MLSTSEKYEVLNRELHGLMHMGAEEQRLFDLLFTLRLAESSPVYIVKEAQQEKSGRIEEVFPRLEKVWFEPVLNPEVKLLEQEVSRLSGLRLTRIYELKNLLYDLAEELREEEFFMYRVEI